MFHQTWKNFIQIILVPLSDVHLRFPLWAEKVENDCFYQNHLPQGIRFVSYFFSKLDSTKSWIVGWRQRNQSTGWVCINLTILLGSQHQMHLISYVRLRKKVVSGIMTKNHHILIRPLSSSSFIPSKLWRWKVWRQLKSWLHTGHKMGYSCSNHCADGAKLPQMLTFKGAQNDKIVAIEFPTFLLWILLLSRECMDGWGCNAWVGWDNWPILHLLHHCLCWINTDAT